MSEEQILEKKKIDGAVLIIILSIAAIVSGYAIGRYVQPSKIEYKTKEVVKEVEVIKRDVVTVEKTIKRPDGTVEKEKRTEDKSTERVNKETESKTEKIVINAKPQWKVQATVGTQFLGEPVIYGVGVERRIIGPFFMGVYGRTSREFGLSVSMEF